jgi:hypothetical protein
MHTSVGLSQGGSHSNSTKDLRFDIQQECTWSTFGLCCSVACISSRPRQMCHCFPHPSMSKNHPAHPLLFSSVPHSCRLNYTALGRPTVHAICLRLLVFSASCRSVPLQDASIVVDC